MSAGSQISQKMTTRTQKDVIGNEAEGTSVREAELMAMPPDPAMAEMANHLLEGMCVT